MPGNTTTITKLLVNIIKQNNANEKDQNLATHIIIAAIN